mmetsp:Transcript_117/g.319  ORF Transcript_117/g.319 Transcript_117/m.319 type:complete len:408 (-) Transcript_117:2513-3736(-)
MLGCEEGLDAHTGFREIQKRLELLRQRIVAFDGPCHLHGSSTTRDELEISRRQVQDLLADLISLFGSLQNLFCLRKAKASAKAPSVACTFDLLQFGDALPDLTEERLRFVQRAAGQAAKRHGLGLDAHRTHGLEDVLRIADSIDGAPRHPRQRRPGAGIKVERLNDFLIAGRRASSTQKLVFVGLPLEAVARGIPHVAGLLTENLAELLQALLFVGRRGALEHASLTNLAPAGKKHEKVLVRLMHQLQMVEAHLIPLEVDLEKQGITLLTLLLCVDLILAVHGVGLVHRDRRRLGSGFHLLKLLPCIAIHVWAGPLGLKHLLRRHGDWEAEGGQHRSHAAGALATGEGYCRSPVLIGRLGCLLALRSPEHRGQEASAFERGVREGLNAVMQGVSAVLVLMARVRFRA